MGLTNSQYQELMRSYDERRFHNRHLMDKRVEEAYTAIPRLKEIDDAIATCSVASARRLISGDDSALLALKKDMAALRTERATLISRSIFPAGYFDPIYTCPDCKDTGYIGSEKCHCMKQAVIDTLYMQSNIHGILSRENFANFSFEYYDDGDRSPATGLTSLETAEAAVADCRIFIDSFQESHGNLFFYGDTGVGKTFMTNCVAKEIMDRGNSVIYFTAMELFDILGKGVFEKDADAIAAHDQIFDCDLLIIDDLGTEFANSFTTSQLFLIVNERILRQKSTIISTNLDMAHLMELYSERTISRITSNYKLIKLFGDDIRIKKRMMYK